MAAGKPVITLAGNGPAVLTGEAGLPVAAPTRQAAIRGVTRAISSLADDRPLRQHLSDSGRARVRDQFLWKRRAEAISEYYGLASDSPDAGSDQSSEE